MDELATVTAGARWATAAIATSVLMFGIALGVLSESRQTVSAIVEVVSDETPKLTPVAEDPFVGARDSYGRGAIDPDRLLQYWLEPDVFERLSASEHVELADLYLRFVPGDGMALSIRDAKARCERDALSAFSTSLLSTGARSVRVGFAATSARGFDVRVELDANDARALRVFAEALERLSLQVTVFHVELTVS
ncbi:MAG: hypothetical protein HY791_21210 [Deltaproteobacteria bacterium]|nr:hypothetical protein [Deltaproteobacteria bacterium]